MASQNFESVTLSETQETRAQALSASKCEMHYSFRGAGRPRNQAIKDLFCAWCCAIPSLPNAPYKGWVFYEIEKNRLQVPPQSGFSQVSGNNVISKLW